MLTIEADVDRYLTLIRNLIRSQGFTQLDVQEALGWGRSYISQLLTKQKTLRVEQVLLILNVIGIEPIEFFGELYGWQPPPYSQRSVPDSGSESTQSLEQLRRDIHGLAHLLIEKQLITLDDLSAVVREFDAG